MQTQQACCVTLFLALATRCGGTGVVSPDDAGAQTEASVQGGGGGSGSAGRSAGATMGGAGGVRSGGAGSTAVSGSIAGAGDGNTQKGGDSEWPDASSPQGSGGATGQSGNSTPRGGGGGGGAHHASGGAGGNAGRGGGQATGGAGGGSGTGGRGGGQATGGAAGRGGDHEARGGDQGTGGHEGTGGQNVDADTPPGPDASPPEDFTKFIGKYKVTATSGGLTCGPDAGSPLQFSDEPLEVKLGTHSDLIAITNPLPSVYRDSCTLKMNADGGPTSGSVKAVPDAVCTHGDLEVDFNEANRVYMLVFAGDGTLVVTANGTSSDGSGTCDFGYSATAVPDN